VDPLLIASFAPALFLLHFIYVRDKYEREPLLRVALVYLSSFVTIVPAAIFELAVLPKESTSLAHVAFASWLVIAASEEIAKFGAVWLLAFNHRSFSEVYDGILYSVAASLGFATAENIFYVMSPDMGGADTAVMRALLSVPGHALWGVMMGYCLGVARFAKRPLVRRSYMAAGVIVAIFWHGLYDFFAFGAELVGDDRSALFVLGVPGTVIVCWIIGLALLRRAQSLSIYKRPSPMVNPIAAVNPRMQYCTNCGRPARVGEVFCTRCGKPLRATRATSPVE
jgi:RsiW-degrading membrane proteinase PrsW (M82 family)